MNSNNSNKLILYIKRNPIIVILFIMFVVATVILAISFKLISNEKAKVTPTPVPTATPVPTQEVVITPHPIFTKKRTDGGLGPEIFEPSEFPGTVKTLNYITTDYANGGEYEKAMRVYLPYGYDDSKKYNVLFLLHGYGGTELYWFDDIRWFCDPDYCNSYECHTQNVLDNMIANGLCEPLIVVSPTYYLNWEWKNDYYDDTARDAYQFRKELRYDIIPALAKKYSTYDVGDRDHFAFIGASNGAEIVYKGILPYALDLISYFGAVSGCGGSLTEIENVWHKEGYDEYDIKYFYTSAGERDFLQPESFDGYTMMKNSSKITDDNIEYVLIRESEHSDILWIDGVYNCLQTFFSD